MVLRSRWLVRWVVGGSLGAALAFPLMPNAVTSARAEEPVQAFLDELRNQRYFDEALFYLEEMRNSPVSPVTFREVIDFERAKTMLASLVTVRERARREVILDEAQQALDLFISEHSANPLADDATELYAGLLMRRSEIAVEKSNQEGIAEGQQQALRQQAREQLAKAQEIFNEVQGKLRTRLERIGSNPREPQLVAMRDDYRVRYMQIQLALPQIKLEIAKSYDEQAPERGPGLAEAEALFTEVRQKYSAFGGTQLLATVGMCQAMQMQGKADEALPYLEDILTLPNAPELREVKRRALSIAFACYESKDPVPYQEMVAKGEPVVGNLFPAEIDDPEWLALQLTLARAYHEAAAELEAKEPKTAEDRQMITQFDNRSVEIVRELTRGNGPLKSDAQQLLASWGIGRANNTTSNEVVNFIQARDRGVAVLSDFDNARVTAESVKQSLATEADATRQAELKQQLTQAEQVLRTAPLEAMGWFERALSLADAETPEEDLAIVRRFMAYLYFVEGKYYHAGVIGESQLRNNPGISGTKASAGIALNAYWALFQEASREDRDFETARLKEVGDLTIKNFPDSDEAIRAANILAFVALSNKDLATARAYLAEIPESSPERLRTRLLIGTQIWAEYLTELGAIDAAKRAGEIDAAQADSRKAALNAMRADARAELEEGVQTLAASDMDSSMVVATLSMAQLELMENRPAEAVKLLERPGAGLLELVKQKVPTVMEPSRLSNIYRTALRAYIGSLATASDKAAQIQKARAIMSSLSESAGMDDAGKQQLIALYVSLVADLRLQLEALPSKEQRRAFGTGVVAFLEEVQKTTRDANTLVWTAETMASVAESLVADGYNTDANQMFTLAEETLKQVAANNSTDEQLVTRARVQTAAIMRAQGKYQDALNLYADILAPNPGMVTVQVEAAMTYHLWGRATTSGARLASAMSGGMPRRNERTNREENVIWGWGKLAQTTARSANYRDTFLQARYQLAYARFEYAVVTNNNDQLARVKRDITGTMTVDAELGGGVWKTKFDALARALQKKLGERETGLAGLE